MKIILDAFGGDKSPDEIIKGAVLAVQEDKEIEVTLLGDENKINEVIKKYNLSLERIDILNCSEVILNTDNPITAVKEKKESTIVKGLNYFNEGKGDIFISAGNTGALFTASNLIIKRIPKVKRSALAIFLPSEKGQKLMLDAGANLTLSPEYYRQLAIMGSLYFEETTKAKNSKIGLINIGTEDHKGTEEVISAYKALKECDIINFQGNCEARDILKGDFDVMVCNGFTGNIILKTLEGTAKTLMSGIKGIFTKNIFNKICALIMGKGLKEFKNKFDYKAYGAAPILGLRKPVMKAHGSSDAYAIKNAIINSKAYATSFVIDKIGEQII